MGSTLADRLKDALAELPRPQRTQRALAAACGIKPPSVNEWFTGITRQISGPNLLAAAKFLDVEPLWLASGRGPKRVPRSVLEPPALMAAENAAAYVVQQPLDRWTLEAVRLMQGLQEYQREGAIAMLRSYIGNLPPHTDGHNLRVA